MWKTITTQHQNNNWYRDGAQRISLLFCQQGDGQHDGYLALPSPWSFSGPLKMSLSCSAVEHAVAACWTACWWLAGARALKIARGEHESAGKTLIVAVPGCRGFNTACTAHQCTGRVQGRSTDLRGSPHAGRHLIFSSLENKVSLNFIFMDEWSVSEVL